MLVLTLGTHRLLSLFNLNERDGSDAAKHEVNMNRLFFTQGFIGKQIDLELYVKPHRQPMKRNETLKEYQY